MSYPVHVYVGPSGDWAGARRKPRDSVSIGYWYASQFGYRPFKDAVEHGAKQARKLVEQRKEEEQCS